MLRPAAIALALACAAPAAAQSLTCEPTARDTDRLNRLDAAWRAARADAVAHGSGSALRRLGLLAQPRLNLDRPQPTPGRYQCRTIKVGAARPGMLSYIAYGCFQCRVELTPGGDLIVRKTTGSQRPMGLVCPSPGPREQRQARFVGVLALGQEAPPLQYGKDPSRDLIGLVERVGQDRWRIAFPWPATESKLDILELRRVR